MLLTVMSYNIRHGLGSDLHVNIDRVSQVINSEKPDVVCLQEVYDFRFWTSRYSQVSALESNLGMKAIFDASLNLGGNAIGNMILVRESFDRLAPIRLPSFGEPRLCQQIVLNTAQGKLKILNTHLGLISFERKRQLVKIARSIDGSMPIILCGDFNSSPKIISKFFPKNKPAITNQLTFPSRKPRKTLDNILVAGGPKIKNTEVVKSTASDHLPIIARLSIT